MRTRVAFLAGASMVLAACGSDPSPGAVLFIVRGLGVEHSDAFRVEDGTYRIEERSQPMSCISSIDIVGSDGRTVATLKPSRPAPPSAPSSLEDPDFSGMDVSLSVGTYEAVGKAPATCRWVVQVTVPPGG